jgi:hypothetical protein
MLEPAKSAMIIKRASSPVFGPASNERAWPADELVGQTADCGPEDRAEQVDPDGVRVSGDEAWAEGAHRVHRGSRDGTAEHRVEADRPADWRSRATRERRRPRHHRSLRDPDRVDRAAVSAVDRHDEEAATAASSLTYMGSRRVERSRSTSYAWGMESPAVSRTTRCTPWANPLQYATESATPSGIRKVGSRFATTSAAVWALTMRPSRGLSARCAFAHVTPSSRPLSSAV